MDAIRTRVDEDGGGGASSASPALGGTSSSARVICKVCSAAVAQYSCPRCRLRYCSLACYKAHGSQCTEGFYKEQVEAELKGRKVDREDQERVLQILKRVHMEDAGDGAGGGGGAAEPEGEDEEDEEDGGAGLSEALLRKIAAGEDVTPEDLTPEELAAFHREAASGGLSHLVAPWVPWWRGSEAAGAQLAPSGTRLVEAVGGGAAGVGQGQDGEEEPSAMPPPPDKPLPPMASLAPVASPDLAWHAVDLAYGYCHTLCTYNGWWGDDPGGAADLLLAVSACLLPSPRGGAREPLPSSAAEALGGCMARARLPAGGASSQEGCVHVAEEAAHLLGCGRAALVCALADAERLFEAAAAESKSVAGGGGKAERKIFRGAARKAAFFQAWANEREPGHLEVLREAVGGEFEALRAAMEGGAGARPPRAPGGAAGGEGGGKPRKANPLIQEL